MESQLELPVDLEVPVEVPPNVSVGDPLDVPVVVYSKIPLGISQEAPTKVPLELLPKVFGVLPDVSLGVSLEDFLGDLPKVLVGFQLKNPAESC